MDSTHRKNLENLVLVHRAGVYFGVRCDRRLFLTVVFLARIPLLAFESKVYFQEFSTSSTRHEDVAGDVLSNKRRHYEVNLDPGLPPSKHVSSTWLANTPCHSFRASLNRARGSNPVRPRESRNCCPPSKRDWRAKPSTACRCGCDPAAASARR